MILATGSKTLVLPIEGIDNPMGYRNYNPLEEQVKAIVPDTYVIGDAIRARRALDATKEAYEVASQI